VRAFQLWVSSGPSASSGLKLYTQTLDLGIAEKVAEAIRRDGRIVEVREIVVPTPRSF
jgi:hypothetical protein